MPEYRVTVEQNQGQTPAWTITFLAEGWTTGVRRFADVDDAARAPRRTARRRGPNSVNIHIEELTIGAARPRPPYKLPARPGERPTKPTRTPRDLPASWCTTCATKGS
ncbi:hypothetical protein GTA09_19820 [Rhodococcus hoagii]|nr:hypothetical protein [Prescottella equi]